MRQLLQRRASFECVGLEIVKIQCSIARICIHLSTLFFNLFSLLYWMAILPSESHSTSTIRGLSEAAMLEVLTRRAALAVLEWQERSRLRTGICFGVCLELGAVKKWFLRWSLLTNNIGGKLHQQDGRRCRRKMYCIYWKYLEIILASCRSPESLHRRHTGPQPVIELIWRVHSMRWYYNANKHSERRSLCEASRCEAGL